MTSKHGFKKLNLLEFSTWLADKFIARNIETVQLHHTWKPSYDNFDGSNHFKLQQGMKLYHVDTKGWRDIGQHFSIFPDGSILTGRSLENSPACIGHNNSKAICIENVGNFDIEKDQMTGDQMKAILNVTAMLCRKVSLPLNDNSIVYHHWFRREDGVRNNGGPELTNKTCPGTNFFGGNKVEDFNSNFLPRLKDSLEDYEEEVALSDLLFLGRIKRDGVKIKEGPKWTFRLVRKQEPLQLGALVRVYEESENGWVKISSSKEFWICKRNIDLV